MPRRDIDVDYVSSLQIYSYSLVGTYRANKSTVKKNTQHPTAKPRKTSPPPPSLQPTNQHPPSNHHTKLMAWVREKNPKPKRSSTPQRDPQAALEGFLSYLACKPAPAINGNVQRYLRESTTHENELEKPEIVRREPTVYDDDGEEEKEEEEVEYEVAPVRNQRMRVRSTHREDVLRRAPPATAMRHVSSGGEGRAYRQQPKTSVQTRRVVSSWSNATTPLVI